MARLDLPPVWLLGFGALVWLWDQQAPMLQGGTVTLWLGRGLILLGVVFAAWAVALLARARTPIEPGHTPRALVTDGPFQATRNPIYRGLVLILAGWTLSCGEVAALVLTPVYAWVLLRRFVEPEEAAARAAFPEEYAAWAAETPLRL